MKRRLTISSSLFSIAALMVMMLSGCGPKTEKSEELKAILNSSAASIQLTTGREVRRSEQDQSTGTGLIKKPTLARFAVEYKPIPTHTKEEVFAEIIATLERENWKPKTMNRAPSNDYRATLSQGDRVLYALVSIDAQNNLVGIYVVTND